jgi:ribosomal protein S18 acetylase RimI-like enzyme
MKISDYDSVTALWKRTPGIGLSEADSRQNIAIFLARNPGLSFVAEDDEGLAGAVMSSHDGRRGFLYHLAVDTHKRRNGVGRALVDRCISGLAALGLRKCHIFVFADNEEGKRFWARTGWQERFDLVVMSRSVGG